MDMYKMAAQRGYRSWTACLWNWMPCPYIKIYQVHLHQPFKDFDPRSCWLHIYQSVYPPTHRSIGPYIYIYVYIYIYLSISFYIPIPFCIYMYVFIHIYIYTHIYTYIYILYMYLVMSCISIIYIYPHAHPHTPTHTHIYIYTRLLHVVNQWSIFGSGCTWYLNHMLRGLWHVPTWTQRLPTASLVCQGVRAYNWKSRANEDK